MAKVKKLNRLQKQQLRTAAVAKTADKIIKIQRRHLFITVVLLALSIATNVTQWIWRGL